MVSGIGDDFRPWPDLDQSSCETILGTFGVMVDLPTQPSTNRRPEKPDQPQIGVGGDSTATRDDLAKALGGNECTFFTLADIEAVCSKLNTMDTGFRRCDGLFSVSLGEEKNWLDRSRDRSNGLADSPLPGE